MSHNDNDNKGTSSSPDSSSSFSVLRLPDEHHHVAVWKVSSGSPVQKGETLAFLTVFKEQQQPKGSKSSNDNINAPVVKPATANATSTSAHKRPSKRRRRPIAAAASSTLPNKAPPATTHRDTSTASSSASTSSSSFSLASLTSKAISTNATAGLLKKAEAKSDHDVDAPAGAGEHPQTRTSLTSGSSNTTIPLVSPRNGILQIYNNNSKKRAPLDIGMVQDCEHPTIVQGLCVVCGAAPGNKKGSTTTPNDATMNMDTALGLNDNAVDMERSETSNPNSSFLLTVKGGLTVQVSKDEQRRMAQLDQERLEQQHKLSLVLDLDHTLLHATHDPRAWAWRSRRNDLRSLVLPVPTPAGAPPQFQTHMVKLRPHIKDFLESLAPLYEIGVYTAGTRHYAEEITLLLARHLCDCPYDPPELEQLRRHCWELEQGVLEETTRQKQEQQEQQECKSAQTEGRKKESVTEETTANNDEDESNQPHKAEPDAKPPSTTTAVEVNDNKDQEGTGSPPNQKKKRKMVSFGEPPPPSDPPKPPPRPSLNELKSQLASKQQELQNAMRMEQMARDLRQRLFGGRIVSRTDVRDEQWGREVKSLKRMFPCGGRMAVVVDDREDVWALGSASNNTKNNTTPNDNNDNCDDPPQGEPPHNLLLVRPYHWGPFAGFADVNNAAGEDLSKTNTTTSNSNSNKETTDKENVTKQDEETEAALADKEEREEQLKWTTDILRRIHHAYYNDYEGREKERPSVPQLVKQLRKNVLGGDKDRAHLLLSGLVPLHRQQPGDTVAVHRPRPQFVRHAENLGATVSTTVHPKLTHTVAAKDGTEKILQVRREVPGCVVVQAAWLMECAWTLTRRDVQPHLLQGSVGRSPPRTPPPTDDRKRKREVEDMSGSIEPAPSPRQQHQEDDKEQQEVITKDSLKQQLMATLASSEGPNTLAAKDAKFRTKNADESGDTDDDLAAAFEDELDEEEELA